VKTVQVARIRALIGAAFALLGAGIAVRLLLIGEPFNQKMLGLGFSIVLIALGIVRIRTYLAVKRELGG
jgi:hypothetical protein